MDVNFIVLTFWEKEFEMFKFKMAFGYKCNIVNNAISSQAFRKCEMAFYYRAIQLVKNLFSNPIEDNFLDE